MGNLGEPEKISEVEVPESVPDHPPVERPAETTPEREPVPA